MPKDVRAVLRDALPLYNRKGPTRRSLSIKLGHAPGYLHDYIEDGVPASGLKFKDAVVLSQELGIPLQKLGVEFPADMPPLAQEASLGHSADIEILPRTEESPIARGEQEIVGRMLTNVLNQHPALPLSVGDLVRVDRSAAALAQIVAGTIVLAYLHDKAEDRATPILREFVAPSLLITNTTEEAGNSILNTRDTTLPFDTLVVGKLTMMARGNGAGQTA